MLEAQVADALPRVFVISDVHVGAGELDDFVVPLEKKLLKFLGVLSRLVHPVHLVINGDFFDFATAEPWDEEGLEAKTSYGLPLCFTEAQSCRKLAKIVETHGAVFDALAALAVAQDGNRITMLPGNHDADLFWPSVREGIFERLAQAVTGGAPALSGRFEFLLERNMVIERGGKCYWIEHGHQHDAPNSFFPGGEERWSAALPPIFKDPLGHWRLYECPGTFGLVHHINRWRRTYRSISYIKPYSKVIRALIEHKSFEEPGRPLMVIRHLAAMLGWQLDLRTSLADGPIGQAVEEAVVDLVETLTPDEEAALISELGTGGIQVVMPMREFVQTEGRRKRVVDHFVRSAAAASTRAGTRVEDTTLGFMSGGGKEDVETQALVQMARELLRTGRANYVLTGHTHVPTQKLNGRFTNSGCWVPNQAVPSKAAAVEAIFKHGAIEYRMNYLEIDPGNAPRLRTFGRGSIRV